MPRVAVEVKPASRRHIILFAIGMLCYWAAMYVYVPIFSVYAESLGASLSVVGLGVGMYGLTQWLTRVPIGIWSDVMGKRRGIVVAGMLVCGVAATGLALSPSAVGLVVFRGVMGLAAATWVWWFLCSRGLLPLHHGLDHLAELLVVDEPLLLQ